jgi:hypothetical protein
MPRQGKFQVVGPANGSGPLEISHNGQICPAAPQPATPQGRRVIRLWVCVPSLFTAFCVSVGHSRTHARARAKNHHRFISQRFQSPFLAQHLVVPHSHLQATTEAGPVRAPLCCLSPSVCVHMHHESHACLVPAAQPVQWQSIVQKQLERHLKVFAWL